MINLERVLLLRRTNVLAAELGANFSSPFLLGNHLKTVELRRYGRQSLTGA